MTTKMFSSVLATLVLLTSSAFAVDNATITAFSPPTIELQRGQQAQATVTVQNAGDTTRSFWVGLSFSNNTARGVDWPEGWYDIYPMQTNVLAPTEQQEVTFTFPIYDALQPGQYYAVTSVWDSFDQDNYVMVNRFDNSFWHSENSTWTEDPELGAVSFVLLSYSTLPNDIPTQFGDIIDLIAAEPASYLYEQGKKYLLVLPVGGFAGSINGVPVSADGSILFDLADICGATPESSGSTQWVTCWIAGSLGGISITNEHVGIVDFFPFGVIQHDFDPDEKGVADYRPTTLQFGKVSCPFFTFTGLTWDIANWGLKGPRLLPGGSNGFEITVEKGDLAVTSFEIQRDVLVDTLVTALSTNNINNTYVNSALYCKLVFDTLQNLNSGVFRSATLDDGDIPLTMGAWKSNLSMDVKYGYNRNANYFVVDVPENTEELKIITSGGSGEATVYIRFGDRPFLDQDFSESVFDHGVLLYNPLTYANPPAGKCYIALDTISNYENVSIVATTETEGVEPTDPTNVSGTISSDTTWSLVNSPYHIVDDVTVASGTTLTIEAGVVVKFNDRVNDGSWWQYKKLIIDGTLNLLGTSGNEVVFTSSHDDAYGGDSNGDGSASAPSAGNWAYVKINNASSTIHHAIFRYGGIGRIYHPAIPDIYYDTEMLWINGCSPTVTDCTFEYAYEKALYYYADQSYDSSPQITNNAFWNCPYGMNIVGSNFDTSPYIAGNQINNASTYGIAVSSSTLTTIENNTINGASDSIVVGSATATIANNTIDDATVGINTNCGGSIYGNAITNVSSYVVKTSGSPTISNNTIESDGNNHLYYLINNASPVFLTNTITGPKQPSTAVSGTISSDTTWSLVNSPYHIVDDVTVASGTTLTIEAGVVVKFNDRVNDGSWWQYKKLIIDGTLNLLGTSGNEVVFTSSHDDAYGGDSNGDGSASAPSAGNWAYVKINNASSTIHHAIFRYGGIGRIYHPAIPDIYYDTEMLWINGCSPTVTDCTFEYAYEKALYYYADQSYDSSPQITNNAFWNCPYGIYYYGAVNFDSAPEIEGNYIRYCNQAGIYLYKTSPETVLSYNDILNNTNGVTCSSSFANILNNNIYGNSSYGVQNSTSSIIIAASNNWWGYSTGPSHAGNPSGTGDAVSDYVDYSPWKTSEVSPGIIGIPEFTSVPGTAAVIDQRYQYDVDNTAEAIGSGPLSYSLLYGPSGFNINQNTGLITWYPSGPGEHGIVLLVENDRGSDIQSFNVYVSLSGGGGNEYETVPNVQSIPYQEAQQVISGLDLVNGNITYVYNDNVLPGYVIRQTPVPDVIVIAGYPVDLLVSRGIRGNLNEGDNRVDMLDFAVLANGWMTEYDMDDLMELTENWLNNGVEVIERFNLDTNPGWTTEGQWEFGIPYGLGGSLYGASDPFYGFTGDNVFGINLSGDYSTTPGGPYYLTAGPFDCTEYSNITLRFARWLNIDEPMFADALIEVSNDGINWQTAWEHQGNQPIEDENWTMVEYDITGVAANSDTVYIRWSYEIFDWAYPYSGWNIDDIEIIGVR